MGARACRPGEGTPRKSGVLVAKGGGEAQWEGPGLCRGCTEIGQAGPGPQPASQRLPTLQLESASLMSDTFKKKGLLSLSKGKKKTHLGIIFMAPFGSLRNHKSRNNDFSLYPPEKNISKD